MVTPALFAKYPTPADLAHADPADVEELIHSTGFFRSKTKNLIGMAQAVEERFGGEVPTELDDLVTLPGVGRKTGNVVRSVWFGLPGLPVDTHVTRLSHRLQAHQRDRPGEDRARPRRHRRRPRSGACSRCASSSTAARSATPARPRCDVCVLADICPSAGKSGLARRSDATASALTRQPRAVIELE